MSLGDVAALDRPLLALALIAVLGVFVVALARRSRAGLGPTRRRLAVLTRAALLTALCFALSGLQWKLPREAVTAVFAIDSSDSARGAPQEDARRFALVAAREARGADRVAVVQFGADALVEEGLRAELGHLRLGARPRGEGTDLAGALRLSRGLLPQSGRRRIVVVTDGAVDGEDPAPLVREALADGIEVLLVPVGGPPEAEVLVDELVLPERAHEGEPFEGRVVLRATREVSGRLTVTRDGEVLGQEQLVVPGGRPLVFRFVERGVVAGTHAYRAHFHAEPDGHERNDAAEALVRVEGRPRVLLVDPTPSELARIATLLEASGVAAERAPPSGLPRSLVESSRWDLVVLSNVDALHVPGSQADLLRVAVRDAGLGLAMSGGPQSFGPGGWYRTPVEAALPVDCDVRSERYYPSLSLACVVDKSGSMAAGDGVTKLDLAKEATSLAVELLHRGDRVGVIAFDSAAKWVVPVQDAADVDEIVRLVGTMRPGGGTDIYPGLELAGEALATEQTVLKHVILLSDGQSPPRDHAALARRLADQRITISTVAVGSDADLALMRRLADLGGGRYYFTDDPTSIPRIFTKEAFTAGRSFLVEEVFSARRERSHPALRGVDVAALAPLAGYVATTAKPAATVALVTHREDPLLALHRHGLGRAGALTTDLGARWAGGWLDDEAARRLLVQSLRWLAGGTESRRLTARLERRGGELVVEVEARAEDGSFLNFADLKATVVGPDLQTSEIGLRQVAPGRYEARIPSEGSGAWFATISQRMGDRVVRTATAATVHSYSDEYRALDAGPAAVERLADRLGVPVVTDPRRVFARTGPTLAALRPAWRELLWLAAALLLLDVAARRVMLPDRWLQRSRPGRSRSRDQSPVATATPLARLRRAKEGAVSQAPEPPPTRTPDTLRPQAEAAVAAPDDPVAPERAGGASPEDDASFAGRLLAAKRRAGRDRGDGE